MESAQAARDVDKLAFLRLMFLAGIRLNDEIAQGKGQRSARHIQDETKRSQHWQLLSFAKEGHDAAIASLAKECDLDLEVTNDIGQSPLVVAGLAERHSTMRLLLNMRANPDYKPRTRDALNTLLTASGDPQVFRIMLEARADPHLPDDFGETPLHTCQNESCLKLLLQSCADIDVRQDKDGDLPGATPLIQQSAEGNHAMVLSLLELRANLNAIMDSGETALDMAARRCQIQCVQPLISATLSRTRRLMSEKGKGAGRDPAIGKGPEAGDRWLSALLDLSKQDPLNSASIHGTASAAGETHAEGSIALTTDDDAVEITKVMSSLGDERPVDEVFEHLRAALLAETLVSSTVKVEPVPAGELMFVRCDDLRSSQHACSKRFRDGRLLRQTVEDIVTGRLDASQPPNFELRVIRFHGKPFSLDNRRLWCAQEAQRCIRAKTLGFDLRLRVRVWTWSQEFDVFLRRPEAFAQAFTGKGIFVRPGKRARIVE
eukprot:TRINITY_DN38610_c0_g1_i1.p1 TRINITY_DN38610_c0_g1~~TRINITY_DN38610_c0_g1_i1.p1  ORF type:complete len:489 (+),score=59.44 TRINITY_DN38610_c0_g1_i1:2-1468(+)